MNIDMNNHYSTENGFYQVSPVITQIETTYIPDYLFDHSKEQMTSDFYNFRKEDSFGTLKVDYFPLEHVDLTSTRSEESDVDLPKLLNQSEETAQILAEGLESPTINSDDDRVTVSYVITKATFDLDSLGKLDNVLINSTDRPSILSKLEYDLDYDYDYVGYDDDYY